MTKLKLFERLHYKQVVVMVAVVKGSVPRRSVSQAWGREGQDTCQPPAGPLQPQRGRGIHLLHSSCGRCTRVGSPRIKRRSVTPNRANKWQMFWISLSSVTTEGLKGPRDCFHMKAASQQNHGKPLPTLQTGWNGDVWSFHIYTTKIQTGIQRQALNGLSVLHMVRLNRHWR